MGLRKIVTVCIVAVVYLTSYGAARRYNARTIPLRKGNVSVVEGLLTRLIPDYQDQFILELDSTLGPNDKDTFVLQSVGDKINVKGTSAIALSMGIHYYLKYFCNAHVSWSGDQLRIPQPLPKVQSPVTVTTQDKYRHYQNVCTVSYSMVWWGWSRWEREIDWMALNGMNLPLAFTAQEAIWRRVYLEYGFRDSEINEFFSGPTFLAWNRMGNMQGFGGPLSPAWHAHRIALQKLILKRMRDFGMSPVLPAFAGRVLPSFQRVFPNSSVTHNPNWMGFPSPYCCTTVLDPLDPLFTTLGSRYLAEYTKEFGMDHFYSADLFNEMNPATNDTTYLRNCGKAVFKALTSVDQNAIWVMQGWLFANQPSFWQPTQAKALLTSVPQGRMLVLDLEAELRPQYKHLQSYYGQPFIWCIIHNYGGVEGMYGSFDAINQGPFEGRSFANSTMIGTGITPEGIERNDVIYDLMNEMAWREEPVDVDEWLFNYTLRRYGKTNTNITNAWMYLKNSVYDVTGILTNHGQYILTSRPSTTLSPYVWYDSKDVYDALKLLLEEADDPDLANQATFIYDITDVTRQGFQVLFDSLYADLIASYKNNSIPKTRQIGDEMMELLDSLDGLLLSNDRFRLDAWIKNASSWATTTQEEAQYAFNALNQITLWGPDGQILDYANKQWGGVVSGYFKPRWDLFLSYLERSMTRGVPFDQSQYDNIVLKYVEIPFTYDFSNGEGKPFTGTVLERSRMMLNRYGKRISAMKRFPMPMNVEPKLRPH